MTRPKVLKGVYILAGVLFTLLGLRLTGSPWSYVALNAGIGYLLVGLAYWRVWPGVLGKRRDGRLMLSSYLLFWPYHLTNWFTCALFRWGLREHPFDRVAPGLFLGGRLMASDRGAFKQAGIRSVLDLTAEFSEVGFIRSAPGYACLPILDRTAPNPEELRMAVEFIESRLVHGAVYVHCALGHGRSAVAVAAWMLKSRNANSPEDAIAKLKAVRPGVNPSAAQRQALAEYARHL